MNTKLTEDFWLFDGCLVYIGNRDFFDDLRDRSGDDYALDVCGDPVFRLFGDGDPGTETSGEAMTSSYLFDLFVKQLKAGRDD